MSRSKFYRCQCMDLCIDLNEVIGVKTWESRKTGHKGITILLNNGGKMYSNAIPEAQLMNAFNQLSTALEQRELP